MNDELLEPAPQTVDEAELAQQDYILTAPISAARRDAFFANFMKSRDEASTTRSLFQWAARYRREQDFNDRTADGFNTLLMKGPFVERSNWFSYQTWDLALAMERHVIGRLGSLIEQHAESVSTTKVPSGWNGILEGFDRLSAQPPADNRLERGIFVVAGGLESTYSRVTEGRVIPRWELPRELRRTWILGMYRDRPIVHLKEAKPKLYAVDIPSFGSLIQYDDYQFDLLAIDQARATELLQSHPDLVQVQAGRPNTKPEKLRELQLRVQLRLYESLDIEVNEQISGVYSVPRASSGEENEAASA